MHSKPLKHCLHIVFATSSLVPVYHHNYYYDYCIHTLVWIFIVEAQANISNK